MKRHLAILLLLTGCGSSSDESYEITQNNILYCPQEGLSVDLSTTNNTTEEAQDENIEPTAESDGTQEITSDSQASGAGLQPAVPGLGIGTVKTAVSEHAALDCEEKNLCKVVGFESGKAIVEHCSSVQVGNIDLSESNNDR